MVTDLVKRDGEHPPTSTNPRGLWVAVTTLNHWWLLCDNVNVTYTDITGAGFTAADTTNAPCTYWSTAEGKAAIFGGAQLSTQGSLSFSTAAGSDNPGKNMNVKVGAFKDTGSDTGGAGQLYICVDESQYLVDGTTSWQHCKSAPYS